MKTRTKVALTALCALLLVAASVLGTLAYLTSETDNVVNTFTAGNVTITLDETDVDLYGVQDGATRVKANELKLVPKHTYVKDPKIHVATGSEDCYVFVKVVNQISGLEADGETIADQMTAKGWKPVADETDVYCKEVAVSAGTSVDVFDNLVIAEDAVVADGDGKNITITGYAVQKDNFNTAQDAWDATFGA